MMQPQAPQGMPQQPMQPPRGMPQQQMQPPQQPPGGSQMATPDVGIEHFVEMLHGASPPILTQLTQDPKYMTNPMYGPLISAELTRRESVRQQKQMEQMQAQQGQQGGEAPTVVEQAQQKAQQLAAQEPAPEDVYPSVARELPADTGIAQLETPNIANMAGGGIVAFAEGGDTEEDGMYIPDSELGLAQIVADANAPAVAEDYGVEQSGGDDIQVGGAEEPATPIGRWVKENFTPPSSGTSEPSRLQLMDQIRREYGGRAGASGFVMKQTAEERQQAKDILFQADKLYKAGDTAGLQALIANNAPRKIAEPALAEPPIGASTPAVPPEAAMAPAQSGAATSAGAAKAGAAPSGGLPGGYATAGKFPAIPEVVAPKYDPDLAGAKAEEERIQRALDEKTLAAAKQNTAEFQQYLKERGEYGKGREERIAAQERELGTRKEAAFGNFLAQAGFAIMSADPRRGALAAIGVGMQHGLNAFNADMDKVRAAAERINAAKDTLEDIRYKQKDADQTQLRQLKSQERATELEGAKAMSAIARQYGVVMPLDVGKTNFLNAYDAYKTNRANEFKALTTQFEQNEATRRTMLHEAGANKRAEIQKTDTNEVRKMEHRRRVIDMVGDRVDTRLKEDVGYKTMLASGDTAGAAAYRNAAFVEALSMLPKDYQEIFGTVGAVIPSSVRDTFGVKPAKP